MKVEVVAQKLGMLSTLLFTFALTGPKGISKLNSLIISESVLPMRTFLIFLLFLQRICITCSIYVTVLRLNVCKDTQNKQHTITITQLIRKKYVDLDFF